MLTLLFKPPLPPPSPIFILPHQVQTRKSLSKCSCGISQDPPPGPPLTSSGESLLSPPGELFPRCRSGWLPLAGGCTQPGAGGPAELRGWVAQTVSKSMLWKCVTSYSYSLPEGFCCDPQGPRPPCRVLPAPCGNLLCLHKGTRSVSNQ